MEQPTYQSTMVRALSRERVSSLPLPLVGGNGRLIGSGDFAAIDARFTAVIRPLPSSDDARADAARQRADRAYRAAKRAVDIVGALFGLLLLLPVFVLTAVLVCLDSHGSALYRRRVLARQTYREDAPLATFDAFKFRTMRPDAEEFLRRNPHLMQEYSRDYKLKDDPRVTRLGRRLRPASVDELPQLINVLRGQMTLVGPRMITPPELAMYGEHAARLLSVKPGLTGLWQVSGRTNVSYRERVMLDMWYIENRSLRLDLEILLRTVETVLQRRGAY